MPVFSIDLDYTVDDAIRKNYNVNGGLPNLPKATPQPKPTPQPQSKPTPRPQQSKISPQQLKSSPRPLGEGARSAGEGFPIRKGMCFELVNSNAISDRQRIGSNIVFTAKKPIKTAYYTIPQGTKFVGKITQSHRPQIAGNGGLVSVSICSIILGGNYQHIDTTITKVGGKRVYFEKIKGKRKYLKNTVAKGKWGRNTFHKTNRVSKTLAEDKSTAVLAPFTFIYGAAMGGVSTITSPVVSIFYKGGQLYIPAGTDFRIRFNQDVKLYY